jgi:hypothetical protein
VLLKVLQGATDAEIVAALGVSRSMVEPLHMRFVEGGLERAFNGDPRPGAAPKLDGKQQVSSSVRIIAVSRVAVGRRMV